MPFPISENNWITQYDKKPTFFGILNKYFDQIGKKYRLSQGTMLAYAKEYERHILPRLNARPLESYTAEEFEQVLADIYSNGSGCARSTLQHYRQLIARVIEAAVQEEGMKDPLWGITFAEITTPKQVEKQERRMLPKSLTPIQQCAIGEEIYSNAGCSGEMRGLMLTFETGTRLKESAGASIGDFQAPIPGRDIACLAIHTTTVNQGHSRHDMPKTGNGYRIGILGPRATEVIRNTMENAQNAIDSGEIILDPNSATPIFEAIPIANSTKSPLIPCASPQLTQRFRHVLRDAGYADDDYLAAQRIAESEEFAEAEKRVTLGILGFADLKDLTAYILRRQFCTDAHIVGCTPEQRQYAMGHKNENPAVDRRDFRNDDMLALLADKLNKRPAINKDVLLPKETIMDGQSLINKDFHEESIRIPAKKGKLIIRVTSHEPLTPVTIEIKIPDGVKATVKYHQQSSSATQRREVNVLNDYYNEFRRAYSLLEQSKAEDKNTVDVNEQEDTDKS